MQFSRASALAAIVGAATVSAQIMNLEPAGTTARVLSVDTSALPSHTSSASGTIIAAPTSIKPYDWASASSAAASVAANRTASSNYTLPVPTATALWTSNLIVQKSDEYVMPELDTKNLPKLNWNLANETDIRREVICGQQTKFCATAGCVEEGAVIKDNFCNVKNLGSRCTCDKGLSNLAQWKWPVQFSDCLGRAQGCVDQCLVPGGTSADRANCRTACQANFGATCGSPGQYSANYAVAKSGDTPALGMMQGGEPSGVAALRSSAAVVAAMAAVAAFALMA